MIIYQCDIQTSVIILNLYDYPETEVKNLFTGVINFTIVIENYRSYQFRSIPVSLEHLVPLIIKKEKRFSFNFVLARVSGCLNSLQTT